MHVRAWRWTLRGAAGLTLLLAAGCVAGPGRIAREPANLSAAKEAVIRYADSGAYEREVRAVAAQARAWIEERGGRRAPGERLAVVFDIDETVLSNYAHMRSQDFGYVGPVWSAWVAAATAPAIQPVREVHAAARRLGVDVIFLTGREEPRDRAGTEANLRAQGMGDYARLILARKDGVPRTSAERKTAARAALAAEGFVIIANLGDQESDLSGGFSERRFKLPNPFYLVP